MNTKDLHAAAIDLRKGEIRRIRNALGQRVAALSGCLWITIDNDTRDIVVKAGEGFSVDRAGDALVSALDDSRFVLLAPLAPQPR